MRQEVVRLNDQLKLADARSQESLQRLSREVAAQQAVTKEAMRQLAADRQPSSSQPPSTPPADIPSSTPVTAPARDPNQKLDYDASVRQGIDLLQNGDAAGALRVAQQLMQSEPGRWEAYSIAGSVAKVQNRPSQAKTMFEKALSLAPDEIKPSLQQALQEIR